MSRFKELGYRRSCFAERGRLRRLTSDAKGYFVVVRNDIDVAAAEVACSIQVDQCRRCDKRYSDADCCKDRGDAVGNQRRCSSGRRRNKATRLRKRKSARQARLTDLVA